MTAELPNQSPVNPMTLTLTLTNQTVLTYLNRFTGEDQKKKAEDAMFVGVKAILSANPVVDTAVVERKFQSALDQIKADITKLNSEMAEKILKYVGDKGTLTTIYNCYLGPEGKLMALLKLFFDEQTGNLTQIISKNFGDQGTITNLFKPDAPDSIINQLKTKINETVQKQITLLCENFDVEKPESGMTIFKKILSDEILALSTLLDEKQKALGEFLKLGKFINEEASQDTEPVTDVMEEFLPLMPDYIKSQTDSLEIVPPPGKQRTPTGQFIVTIGSAHKSAGKKILIETRTEKYISNYDSSKDQVVRLRDALNGVNDAKKVLNCQGSITIFPEKIAPEDVGVFRLIGNNFFIVLNPPMMKSHQIPFLFEQSLKLAKTILTLKEIKKEDQTLDRITMQKGLSEIFDQLKNSARFNQPLKEINDASAKISKILETIETRIKPAINKIIEISHIDLDTTIQTEDSEE